MKKAFPEHPGTMTLVDVFHGTSREVPIDEIPEEQRFVYFKGDEQVDDPDEATSRIPVVHVEMTSTDAAGQLAPPDSAAIVRIHEFGPERRRLRTTTMRR